MLGMQNGKDGYFDVLDEISSGQRSPIPGIFLAGAATGPKTIPDTLADARAAATQIDKYLTDIFPNAKDLKQLIKTKW
jgi:heterodisulfide reductase subunit A